MFTAQDHHEFREAFDLFDRDNDGYINLKEFATIMRALGQKYQEMDLEEMFHEADNRETGIINFGQFYQVLEVYFKEDTSEEGIIQAFRAFDKEATGLIKLIDLKDYLTTYGDIFSEEEAKEFLEHADINKDGRIPYELFVSTIVNS